MSEALTKKVTPTAAFRAVMAPYRDKLERSDAERGKLEGRLRRSFDQFDAAMKEIWGDEATRAEATNGTPPEVVGPETAS
jgi:hypothetical protein